MKKFITGLFILGALLFWSPIYASTITDLKDEIKNLKQQILDLRSKLGGAVAGSLPDLVPLDVEAKASFGKNNKSRRIYANIKNQGSSSEINKQFYSYWQYSPKLNGLGNISYYGVKAYSIGTFPSGKSLDSALLPYIDFGFELGYSVRFCVDVYNNISEFNESNNCSDWVNVLDFADLSTKMTVYPTKVEIGKSFNLEADVFNNGKSYVLSNTYKNHFEIKNSLGSITNLPPVEVPESIWPGSSSYMESSYSMSTAGTYKVRACADQSSYESSYVGELETGKMGSIEELDEINNCSEWVNFTVTDSSATSLPDLSAKSTRYPTTLKAGEPYEFEIDIYATGNSGEISYDSYNSHFEFKNLTTGQVVGSVPVQSSDNIIGNDKTWVNTTYAPTSAGTWSVRGCVDQYSITNTTGSIKESNEYNNCSEWVNFTVTDSSNPVNGIWSAWTPATSTCGEGTYTQTRTCAGASNGGVCLPDSYGSITTRQVQKISCDTKFPDITAQIFTPDSVSVLGDNIKLKGSVKNSGDYFAQTFHSGFEIKDSLGNIVLTAKLPLNSLYLAVNQTQNIETTENIKPGSYSVRLCGDYYNVIKPEISEDNNCSGWINFVVPEEGQGGSNEKSFPVAGGSSSCSSLSPFTSYLIFNSKGEQVRLLQTLLTKLGYLSTGIDGNFGINTYFAVRRYQVSVGLPATGSLGPETRIKLNESWKAQCK